MNNPKLYFALYILITLTFLSSCSGFAPKPTLQLEPCTVGNFARTAKCGYLHVPEDRTNPGGRMLDLAVVVVPAREADPEPDPLFYVAGGPGTAATMTGYINNAKAMLANAWAVIV